MDSPDLSIKPKPPYWVGIFCIIPVIGAVVGFVMIIFGVAKYKSKWFCIIGAGGLLITVATYVFVIYDLIKNRSFFSEAFTPAAQMELNNLPKSIEFYKLQYGHYPDSLKELAQKDSMAFIADPMQGMHFERDPLFKYERIGEKYILFSAGRDGIANTADDLFPEITITDSTKIGLIRPQ